VDTSLSGDEFVGLADSDQDITVSHKTPEELDKENEQFKNKKGGNPSYKNSIHANPRGRKIKAEDRTFGNNTKPAISVDFNGVFPVPYYESTEGLRRYAYRDPFDDELEIGHLSDKRHRNYQPTLRRIFKWIFHQEIPDLDESFERLYTLEYQPLLEVHTDLINATLDPFDFFHF
jgi:hypothetical protein